MKSLNVMGLDFTLKAIINGYNSIVLTRIWNDVGSMHIEINKDVLNANLITIDSLVWLGTDINKVYIVERIEETFENGAIILKFDCLAIESLLQDFITVPPVGDAYDVVTGTRELIVRTWLDNNAISDISRNQYPIILGTYYGYGSSITEQTRYKNLLEEIKRILLPELLSFNLILDNANQQLIFNVYESVDKTYDNAPESTKIIFGSEYGNISKYVRFVDNVSEKNYMYVAGQGQGELRTVIQRYRTADRRKELFVDARDISDTADLQERGDQHLSEYQSVDNFEFEVIDRQYSYETDYDLGDIVTIVLEENTYYDRQIVKITEIYEKNKINIIPEFGTIPMNFVNKINKVKSRIAVVETV